MPSVTPLFVRPFSDFQHLFCRHSCLILLPTFPCEPKLAHALVYYSCSSAFCVVGQDLSNEEEVKLDLGLYFTHFQQRRHDRMFLNGPDIASFYRQPPPEELFSDVQGMDPALQMPQSWTVTGRLADCTDVCAVSTGTDLSEVSVEGPSCGFRSVGFLSYAP